ncbi:MAG: LacI family DNA-binding transcriptional regulator [Bacteroidota bacterium]
MNAVSQKDIADALNVSRVTVTKALKDHPDIAMETKLKVKNLAEKMGYIPSRVAQSLNRQRTNTIGLVIPKIAHSFFSQAVELFYEEAHEHGFELIPMISFEDSKNEEKAIKTLLSMRVDALIIDLAGSSQDSLFFEKLEKLGIPFIFFDRCPKENAHSSVIINDYLAAYEATIVGLKKGYKRPMHFSGPDEINIGAQRKKGFLDALKKSETKYPESSIAESGFTEKGGYKTFLRITDLGLNPDFVLAVNDSVAHGIYRAAEELGISIPNQLGVIGFGDIETSKMLNPALTTVRLPLKEMVRDTMKIIVNKLTIPSPKALNNEPFTSELIVRGSLK